MPYCLSSFVTLRCHFEGYLHCLKNLGDESGIKQTPSRMRYLMRLNHCVANDGWEIDLMVVKNSINEVGSVICQHTPIDGREYVVGKDAVEDLDNGPTLLVRQTIGPVYKLLA